MVREDQEGRGDHHGHLSHGRPYQRGRVGCGCGQQWCELQVGSVTSGVSRTVVCVSVCICCSANCSSPLMWEDQCVCAVSAVEVCCTHLLPSQAAVPPPVQGTGPPSFCSESCVLCQVPHSVSLCQCETGELRRGLCAESVPIFGNVVHQGVESELAIGLTLDWLTSLGHVYQSRCLLPIVISFDMQLVFT